MTTNLHGKKKQEEGGRADRKTETKHFIYFYLGHCAILLFKTQ